MKCLECLPLVDVYYDGELDEQTAERVTQHMGGCMSCTSYYQKLEGENELYLRYECNAQPMPDFWDNVMVRAAQGKGTGSSRTLSRLRGWFADALGNFSAPRFSPSATALLLLVAIGITVGVMRYLNSREKVDAHVNLSQSEGAQGTVPLPKPNEIDRPTISQRDDGLAERGSGVSGQPQLVKNRIERKNNAALAVTNGGAGRIGLRPRVYRRKQTPEQLVREAEQNYVMAIAMLSRDVNRRPSRLDRETALRFERTLSAVDRTIADTRRAARKHPGDPVAAQYMLTAYSRKVDVLREMVSY